jgi:TRAP-type C4-dicarboxylate transport system permease small subunit
LEDGEPVIDQAFDRIARVIEVTLALAFIFAVLLNFANVVGRYLLGLSLLGADEVQIFIMVAMTFLGAAVVTRRNLHLRMDVWCASCLRACAWRCASPSRCCSRRLPASC